MAVYFYRAKNKSGQIQEGELQVQTKEEAFAKIDSLGLFPISIETRSVSHKKSRKVPLRELVEFTHQLSTLINSGSSLASSLNILSSETEYISLKPIVLDVISEVKEGKSFSKSLAKYPHVFPKLYISLVKIGEVSGTLGENLKRTAQFMEEELDFRTNIISALTYPLLIMCVGIGTIFILLNFVIPKLVDIFEEIGQVLPLPTLVLINISHFFSRFWFLIPCFIILFFFSVKRYLKSSSNKLKLDRLKFNLPLLGDLLKRIEICRFSRALSVLLKNATPLDSSLNVLAQTVSNVYFQKAIEEVEEKIKEGFSLNNAMKNLNIFGPTFINVVAVGENSGTLPKVLENISNDYTKDIERRLKRLLNFLEPLLILGVGLMVGFVVLAMLLPIFQMDFNF